MRIELEWGEDDLSNVDEYCQTYGIEVYDQNEGPNGFELLIFEGKEEALNTFVRNHYDEYGCEIYIIE